MNFAISPEEAQYHLSPGLQVDYTCREECGYVISDRGTGETLLKSHLLEDVDESVDVFDLREVRRLRASKAGQKLAIVEETMAKIEKEAYRACQSLSDRGIRPPAKLKKLARWEDNPDYDGELLKLLAA